MGEREMIVADSEVGAWTCLHKMLHRLVDNELFLAQPFFTIILVDVLLENPF